MTIIERITPRWRPSFFLVVVAVLVASGAALWPTTAYICRSSPTIECLANSAIDTLESTANGNHVVDLATSLASAGYYEKALSLETRIPEETLLTEHYRERLKLNVAAWRSIRTAEKRGFDTASFAPLEALIDKGVPLNRVAGAYSLVAWHHLGRSPYGVQCSPLGPDALNGSELAERLAYVGVISTRSEQLLEDEGYLSGKRESTFAEWPVMRHIEVLLKIDAYEEALRAYKAHNRAPRGPSWIAMRILPSEEALSLARQREFGKEFFHLAQEQRRRGQSSEVTRQPLFEAFGHARVKKSGLGKGLVDFELQRKIALEIDALGYREDAKRLVDEMALEAPDKKPFQWFEHLEVARAFLDLRLEAKARLQIAKALALMPEHENQVLAVGLIGGAYTMRGGIGAETHEHLSKLYWRLGEVQLFKASIDYIENYQRNRGWRGILWDQSNMSDVDKLLEFTPLELRPDLTATAAHNLLLKGARDDANQLGWRAISSGRTLTSLSYRLLVRVGHKTNDIELIERALRSLVNSALSGNSGDLSDALATWATCAPDVVLSE